MTLSKGKITKRTYHVRKYPNTNARLTIEEDDEISVRLPIVNATILSFPITSLKLNASGLAFIKCEMSKVCHKNPDFSKVYIKEIDDLRKKLNECNQLKKLKNLKRRTI